MVLGGLLGEAQQERGVKKGARGSAAGRGQTEGNERQRCRLKTHRKGQHFYTFTTLPYLPTQKVGCRVLPSHPTAAIYGA